MATFTTSPGQTFPVGTTVTAYLRSDQGVAGPQRGVAPQGSAQGSPGVVGDDGRAALTGLADNVRYVAYAQVAAVWVFERFMTAVAPSSGSAGTAGAEPVVYYDSGSGTYPLRSTVTADTAKPVTWSGPSSSPPSIGGAYAINNLDFWRRY